MTNSRAHSDQRSQPFNTAFLRDRFRSLLERHVGKLPDRGRQITVLCLFHPDKSPSLSINLEKAVFHCFGCGVGGGVKEFARLLGEEWGNARSQSRAAKARWARFQAEQRARVILQRRIEERDKQLCTEHRELYGEMLGAKDLFVLFHLRSDLAAEFSELVTQTEREYGDLLYQCTLLEARLDGEIV